MCTKLNKNKFSICKFLFLFAFERSVLTVNKRIKPLNNKSNNNIPTEIKDNLTWTYISEKYTKCPLCGIKHAVFDVKIDGTNQQKKFCRILGKVF